MSASITALTWRHRTGRTRLLAGLSVCLALVALVNTARANAASDTTRTDADSLGWTAPLEAARSAQLCALLSAQVRRVGVAPGDTVGVGDTLIWLDDQDLRLAETRAGLAHQQATAYLDRATQLHRQGGLSTQDLETLRFQAETARLRYEQAHLDLSRTTLVAPIRGIVAECLVQAGDLTHPGQVLCRIIDPQDLKATLYLSLDQLAQAHLHQPVLGRPLALADLVISGRICRLSPVLDPHSGCGPVEVLFPRAGRLLRPGALVRVQPGQE